MAHPAGTGTVEPAMLTAEAILSSLTIPGDTRDIAQARAFVAKLLGAHHPWADVACLLVSELVTNAVQHSRSRYLGGTVTVQVSATGIGLRVDVADDGSTGTVPAVMRSGPQLAASGRGLVLVEALATTWGYLCGPTGTTVWFTLAS